MFGWFAKKKIPEQSVQEDVIDDKELEINGIDPVDQIEDIPSKEEALTDFSCDYPGYLVLDKEQILNLFTNFNGYQQTDDTRHELGHKKGGRICGDMVMQGKLRSISKEVIKQIGRKILTGSLNLTKISFPIKAMIPKTALETAVHATCLFPFYLNKAAIESDPLERFKYVIVTTISSFYYTNTFLKPLNPVLGETLQAEFRDGTQVYCEQISHHPPISYFLIFGPNNSYKYYGRYDYDAKAGLNSLSIYNKGQRSIIFNDGQKIDFDFPNEQYSGTLIGTLKQESIGKMVFQDIQNDLNCEICFGKVKNKPSDYFQSTINKGKQQICQIQGTYLGYIDINDKRYFDHREFTPIAVLFIHIYFLIQLKQKIEMKKNDETLSSDHKKRNDLITLKQGNIKQAQIEKEIIEKAQRYDNNLRKQRR
ncbi:oxysterol binding, putative [Ichthyophthirius multifiliis]|uniref:Oxysterol binding, putative n=1 Tax=Ichthyophthirius multifiliis TaxID=5932 RepID=G0R335_ICHMU|nr:oxysterol binding, putative [Ichthyophthirius multifiliis]EGR28111.1 oxysterol binding, putative [Ichthyophthirius multifiliis]|eukprot:XP_004027456.1 oxysterol binding, putative [Ichthyophthirius multifiliis]